MGKLTVFLWVLLCAGTVYAGQIVAIVGDTPISGFDVDQRIALLKTQQADFGRGQTQKQIKKNVLEMLINEKIKIQEAQKQNMRITDEDVQNAIARLEQQNGLKAGDLVKVLKEKGIQKNALESQIRADLMWLQILQQHKDAISPVTDADIKIRKEKIMKELEKPGFLVAEILLPPSTDGEAVFKEITAGGDFADVAEKYSIAKSVDNKGYVGWISTGHYPSAVDDILLQMKGGQLSRPIKVQNGTLLILMLDKKEPAKNGKVEVWELAQMATPKENTVKAMPQILAQNKCADFMKTAQEVGIMDSIKQGLLSPSQLPEELRRALKEQPQSTAVGPVQTPDGDLFFMRCSTKYESIMPSDETIKGQLEMEKMEDISDMLLKRFKRHAVVEYK